MEIYVIFIGDNEKFVTATTNENLTNSIFAQLICLHKGKTKVIMRTVREKDAKTFWYEIM